LIFHGEQFSKDDWLFEFWFLNIQWQIFHEYSENNFNKSENYTENRDVCDNRFNDFWLATENWRGLVKAKWRQQQGYICTRNICTGTYSVSKHSLCNYEEKKDEFEDTKGVIRIRKSKKNKQHNGQKKKDKGTNSCSLNISKKSLKISKG